MSEVLEPIRSAIEGAPVAQPAANDPAPEKEPRPKAKKQARAETAMREVEPTGPYEELPEGCPVIPLGVKGDDYFYLDAKQQLRIFKAKDHGRLPVLSLFGDASSLLYDYWPRHDEKGNVTSWRPEKAAEALMGSAADRGIIDPTDMVRGPGAWRSEDGQLILHCGDVIYSSGDAVNQEEPGKIGRHIYPADAPKPRPAVAAGKIGPDAALAVLEQFKTWNWRRKEQDPHLLLGWIAASMLGGALKWRPLVWITGDAATGKSTLHDMITAIQGAGGMVTASDASAAGLWQKLGHASLPVALDELESEDDNRKNTNIIKLARHAASGGSTLRGGSDHKGASFTIRNCFLFSSILIPPLLGQDLSRMAILQLDALETGRTAPHLEPRKLTEIGAAFRARLMERWDDLCERLETFRGMLAQAGHGGRGADVFGTLLACYDVLTSDYPPDSDTLEQWRTLMDRTSLAETEDNQSDAQKCMNRLLSSICDVYRDGARRTVGSWIQQAHDGDTGFAPGDANRILAAYGLRVKGEGADAMLLVANDHEGLASLFEGTRWARGVWVQSMRRWPGNVRSSSSTNFGGSASRYTAIPCNTLWPDEQEGDNA